MKPILFNTEMVRAILNGRKTVTRRVIKQSTNKTFDPFWECYTNDNGKVVLLKAPYSPGDILYVREAWGDYRECEEDGESLYYLYRADYPDGATTYQHPGGMTCELPKWHPSIHMPKEAARIFLRVTDVRVERLRDITEADAAKEGLYKGWRLGGRGSLALTVRQAFMWLWMSLTEKGPVIYTWALNPWVWVIEFERCEKPKEDHEAWNRRAEE